jgi:hypothetical protein
VSLFYFSALAIIQKSVCNFFYKAKQENVAIENGRSEPEEYIIVKG